MSSPVASGSSSLGIAERMVGVLRSPRRTMASLVANPQWTSVLVITFVLTAAARVGFMTTEVGRQALTDQWEQRIEAFGGEVDDARYARLMELGDRAWQVASATAVASGLVLPFALAAALHAVFARAESYREALAVVVHANVILALRDVVAAPVNYIRESLGSPLALGTFFRMLDADSAAARLLAMIDFFIVWWAAVLAIGTAVLYRRSARSVAWTFMGAYGVFALVLAGIMAFASRGQ